MNLIWTEPALNDYDECITYLEQKFSEKEVFRFVQKMNDSIDLIRKNPNTFPLSNYKNIRYLVVIKPITIFYTLHNEDTVQIIRIWNNRKDRRLFK